MCSFRIARSSASVKSPFCSQEGFWLCHRSVCPGTTCLFFSANSTMASARPKLYRLRSGWMKSHFIWFSGDTELNSAASRRRYSWSLENGSGYGMDKWWPPPATAVPMTRFLGATHRSASCFAGPGGRVSLPWRSAVPSRPASCAAAAGTAGAMSAGTRSSAAAQRAAVPARGRREARMCRLPLSDAVRQPARDRYPLSTT